MNCDCYLYYEYLNVSGENLFTMIFLPDKNKKYPVVVYRSPYVSAVVDKPEDEILQTYYKTFVGWLKRGYAVVYQHCRGQGKSTGAFVPYIHEREDGLTLREWIRRQSFYNGEIFLLGASYTASLHYATAPFEDDVKGAIFEVQDSDRYRLWYRNGQMRKGHANWHFWLYKSKCGLNKKYNIDSFSERPLKNLSDRVLGDRAEDFEQMLKAQYPSDDFWNTRFGGRETKNAVTNANIPILLSTGYNDFYIGGMFDMWKNMDEQTKRKSAFLVSPYNHSDGYVEGGLSFPNGKRSEQFGAEYKIDWIDNIRFGTPLLYSKGEITYYRTFENTWKSGGELSDTKEIRIPLGKGEKSFEYNPANPTAFSAEGTFAEESDSSGDYISVYTKPFERDVFIKGKIKAKLKVASSCDDSSFYVRLSIKNNQHSYVLRHDITSLCYQLGDYTKNNIVTLDFSFDEYAFLLKKGDCLRIDIASTDNNTYVVHTNKKGNYYLQDTVEKAVNTVYLEQSYFYVPVEQ
ncbi:MAG: CocE/NonD family hydrolase [Clostridia bacterium]|nr:CocE/NonD family hydrolase [Clostridia bacterium]